RNVRRGGSALGRRVRVEGRWQLRAATAGRRARVGGAMTTGELIIPRWALGDLRRHLAAPERTEPTRWFESDPNWFQRAVFYEIHIRGFADGNDDGIGDFLGLTDRLDYLQWLGIDCIWLLPF